MRHRHPSALCRHPSHSAASVCVLIRPRFGRASVRALNVDPERVTDGRLTLCSSSGSLAPRRWRRRRGCRHLVTSVDGRWRRAGGEDVVAVAAGLSPSVALVDRRWRRAVATCRFAAKDAAPLLVR